LSTLIQNVVILLIIDSYSRWQQNDRSRFCAALHVYRSAVVSWSNIELASSSYGIVRCLRLIVERATLNTI